MHEKSMMATRVECRRDLDIVAIVPPPWDERPQIFMINAQRKGRYRCCGVRIVRAWLTFGEQWGDTSKTTSSILLEHDRSERGRRKEAKQGARARQKAPALTGG